MKATLLPDLATFVALLNTGAFLLLPELSVPRRPQ